MKTIGLPGLIILVSLGLVTLVVLVLVGAVSRAALPWAGVLAGVLAVLHSAQLQNAAPLVRKALLGAGAATAVLMTAVALMVR